ncbi:MAG: 16S rRNA (cytosine(967)-C(5))-methyltransferase RsmB [Pseudomonadota bacterium]|nr:16S rRNA (cytosine(967)-C(5))-methyltransferase RsmB [Pseudomonadota bacterium]
MPTAQQNHRAGDAQVIAQVCRGLVQVVNRRRTLDWLRSHQDKLLATPLHQELLYGTTRHYFSLTKLISEYLAKPLRSKDQDLYALLLVGAYQLRFSRKPDHAIVNGAVNTCAALGKPWARGLINGVLRKVQRNTNAIADQEDGRLNHPDWFARKITAQYPNNSSDIFTANDQRGPMALRVNTRKINFQDYCRVLDQQGIQFALGAATNSLVLVTPQPAASLPHWQDGFVAVQELSAQFPSGLLLQALSPDLHSPVIFDACSAPGGKLLQLHEGLCGQFSTHRLIGNDKVPERLEETRKIAQRLGHSDDARLILQCADATHADVVAEQSCDAILLDAPCSGSGTIRRNPDIRILLQPEHLDDHQATQLQLLHNLWRGLKQGGNLLYSTCSLFDEENDQVIQQFVSAQPDTIVASVQLPYGTATRLGWQMLPTEPLTDGFYYAMLRKAVQ